jgi:hypothetical protein
MMPTMLITRKKREPKRMKAFVHRIGAQAKMLATLSECASEYLATKNKPQQKSNPIKKKGIGFTVILINFVSSLV